MKQIKRTAGLLLALVLALTFALPAWAAGYVPPATCTVHFGGAAAIMPLALGDQTDPSGQPDQPGEVTRTWVGYRLLDLDVSLKKDAAGTHTHDNADPAAHTEACYNYAYHVRTDAAALTAILVEQANAYKNKVADWKDAADETVKPEVTQANLVKFMETIKDDEVRGFADAVYRAIQQAGDTVAKDMAATATDGIAAAAVKQGYWLFADVTTFADNTDKVNSLVVLATKGREDVIVSPKLSLPEVTKTATAAGGTAGNAASVNVGDKINFVLTGTLPDNFLSYTTYQYVFHDTLSAGLVYDNNAEVYLVDRNDVETKLADGVFTVTHNSGELTVSHTNLLNVPEVITAYRAGGAGDIRLRVKYSATLAAAALETGAEDNRVYLTYSNNPYTDTVGRTTEKKVDVYDFDLLIDKYEAGKTDTKLQYAEFILYKKAADDTKSYYKVDEATKRVTWVAAADAAKVVTDENGAARFTGLAEGTYYLQEVKAPDGYNLAKEQTVTLNNANAVSTAANPQPTVTVQMANSTGTVLPSTGGMGTVIFYALGAALVLAAAVLLARRPKPDKSGR